METVRILWQTKFVGIYIDKGTQEIESYNNINFYLEVDLSRNKAKFLKNIEFFENYGAYTAENWVICNDFREKLKFESYFSN